jgi:hypothetical protein
MNPWDYGDDFYCQSFTVRLKDGGVSEAYDVLLCIQPQGSAEATLDYAWQAFRQLSAWVCMWAESHPAHFTYRVVIAWSKSVRAKQGHIFKVWASRENVCKLAAYESYKDYAATTRSIWIPLARWDKDVFDSNPA